MSWFKKKPKEVKDNSPFATALVDMYSLGRVTRQGDRVKTSSPLYLSHPHLFEVDEQEWEDFHNGQ